MSVPIRLASMPGSGKVFVSLEIPGKFSTLGIPQELDSVLLATIPLTRTGSLKINLPITKQVLAHTSSGLATYLFSAWFGNNRAVSEASVPVAPAPGNDAAAMGGSVDTIMFTPFEKATAPAIAPTCDYEADGRPAERVNLIGQMQDSAGRGSTVSFDYTQTADSTYGVGWSDSFAKHYSVGGSFTVSNSLGSDGGFTAGPGFNRFVFGHFYRQRYKSTNALCSTYEVKYVKAAGDAFPASKTAKAPRRDPYGRCGNDPNGLDQMTPNGGRFGNDRAHATTYSAAATIFNLQVNGSTGYTDGIHIAYKNNSSRTEFVCGNDLMPNAPKLWSNNDQGR